jgi:hypothetical protein
LIINGTGEGNRTLETNLVVKSGGKWFKFVIGGEGDCEMRFLFGGFQNGPVTNQCRWRFKPENIGFRDRLRV